MNDFDCIVIGSGMGGMAAAGRLAAKGIKVLVLEKNNKPGGYLQSFKRKGFIFDSSVDCFSGCEEDGPIYMLLKSLGVEKEIEFIKVDPIRTSMFPDMTVRVHADMNMYVGELKRLFPREVDGIESFFGVTNDIYDEIKDWTDCITGLKQEERIHTTLFKYNNITYGELLDSHIKDNRLKSVLSDRCPFYGLPPKKVSAIAMTALVMSYFKLGAFRVKGGTQKLADTIVTGIRSKGGKVLYKKKVVCIATSGNKTSIVRTADGSDYSAKYVVSNIDFVQTTRDLMDVQSEIRRSILNQAMPDVSSSFFILYAGAKLDLTVFGQSSSIGFYPTFDMESNFTPKASFSQKSSIGITIPSILDSAMAPQGMHSISAHEMVSFSYTNSWKENKARLTEKLLTKVERVIPNLKKDSVYIEAATPATLERYTGNTEGSAYGWMQVPGLRPMKTFTKDIYLAGHWEGIGGGVLGAAYSGLKAAREIESFF